MSNKSDTKRKRKFSDFDVEKALYSRAIGLQITKKKTVFVVKADGEEVLKREESQTEDVPPDVKAAVFWLKNRQPDAWKDGQEISVENNDWIDALTAIVAQYPPEDHE